VDTIAGGGGNDKPTGGSGGDYLAGWGGDDKFYAADGTPDELTCGNGFDRVWVDTQDLD